MTDRSLEALSAALEFLAARQLPSGELPTLLADSPDLSGARQLDSCVFSAAVAGCGLRLLVSDPLAEAVLRRIRGFLVLEMGDRGLWRYWTGHSGKPIDPDLDDTALASFVLADEHPELAGVSRAAMLANRDRHGRFRTWVRVGTESNDVDSVVNANVALSLGDCADVGAACAELNRLVTDGDVSRSYRYYLSDIALFHALARAYAHGVRALAPAIGALRARLIALQRDDGSFGDELETALATAALVYCGGACATALEGATSALLSAQRPDGSWPARALYAGPEPPARLSVWFGSEELTSAICVEALALLSGARPPGPRQLV